MTKIILALFITLCFGFPTVAGQRKICIIWDNQGRQIVGEPCEYEYNGTAFGVRSYNGNRFSLFVKRINSESNLFSVVGGLFGQSISGIISRDSDGVFIWLNGAPALSVEEYEEEN